MLNIKVLKFKSTNKYINLNQQIKLYFSLSLK